MKTHVTVVLPTYNSTPFLEQCLSALQQMDYAEYDILVVDDCSSDNTVEHLQQNYPEVRIIRLPKRSGHSAACNAGILGTDARYVYIVEHHTIVMSDTLRRLMKVMTTDPEAAICYSRQINIYDEHTLAVEGKRFAHYVVNQQCEREFHERVDAETFATEHCLAQSGDPVDVTSAGTFSYLIDREKFTNIGLFDEDYFIHINDYELTLRAKASGWKCLYVPTAMHYHKSFVAMASTHNFRGGECYPAFRTFVISRNRWLLMLSYYSIKSLCVLAPALLLYECLLIGFVIRRGVLGAYLKAIGWLLVHPHIILRKRRAIQRIKAVHDTDLLVAGDLNFVPGLTRSRFEIRMIQGLTRFLSDYWKWGKQFLA